MLYDINGRPVGGNYPAIESYYVDEMEDTIQKVRSVADAPALVFPVVTDIHRYTSQPQTFDKMVNNIWHFTKKVPCDFVLNLGDTIHGDAATDKSLEYALDATSKFKEIGIPYFFVQGNHDNNPYAGSSVPRFNIKQEYRVFFNGTRGVTPNDSENGTDYYIDMDWLGIRLVVLNACNTKVISNYGYGTSTAAWLQSDALNTNNTILLASHLSSIASQVGNNHHGVNADAVRNVLQAFVSGGGKIVQFSGHSHVDIAFLEPWMSVMMACQLYEHDDVTNSIWTVISGYIDVVYSPTRTVGTSTEDLWTACVLKPSDGELDCIRFGAGFDRYFHYEPIAPTTLTTRLSNVTWSSSNTSVATVSNGVVTGVASGTSAILAKDADGNYEAWLIKVE